MPGMREHGPQIAIVALLITLGGALYGWASSQGALQQQVIQLQRDVTTMRTEINDSRKDFQGLQIQVARWAVAQERANIRRDEQ